MYYLQEVKQDIETPFTSWVEIDEEVNATIDSVADIVLTKVTKADIHSITEYMTAENIDKLKDRLNEKVVHSRGTLEREIAIIEAYLYLGEMKPGQSEILTNDRSKLETYVMLLKNYNRTMGENNVIIVDRLGMEFGISDTHTVPWSGEVINVKLVPTDKTHEIIERWKLVQEKHPQVEVPEEDILSQDWYKISKKLKKIEVEFGTDTTNYIIDSVLREGETIENLLSNS